MARHESAPETNDPLLIEIGHIYRQSVDEVWDVDKTADKLQEAARRFMSKPASKQVDKMPDNPQVKIALVSPVVIAISAMDDPDDAEIESNASPEPTDHERYIEDWQENQDIRYETDEYSGDEFTQ